MFNLNKKVEYGLDFLSYLAEKDSDKPIALKEIAAAKELPYKYLEQIAADLRESGIIKSKEGKGGGYMLAANPSDISIAVVVKELAGPVALGACASCPRSVDCTQQAVWGTVGDRVRHALEEKTLEDLVGKYPVY